MIWCFPWWAVVAILVLMIPISLAGVFYILLALAMRNTGP